MEILPENIGSPGSFLTDEDIRGALPIVFREGSYDVECVRHASYQLRLDEVKVCSRPTAEDQHGEYFEDFQQLKWKEGQNEEFVDIGRRQVALLYTREFFTFPHNTLGFTVARGLLFSLALTPENTYVDPGFSGKLYVTIVNNNENSVRLCRGMPISRLFIFKLAKRVETPYVAGSDMGIEQQLKQVPVRAFWSEERLRKVHDRHILDAVRNGCSIGDLLTQIIRRRMRKDAIHTAWLVFMSVVLVLLIVRPYMLLLLERVSLPTWLPKEAANALLTLVLGGLAVVIEHYVKSLLFSRKD